MRHDYASPHAIAVCTNGWQPETFAKDLDRIEHLIFDRMRACLIDDQGLAGMPWQRGDEFAELWADFCKIPAARRQSGRRKAA